MIQCEICYKEFKNKIGLSSHITQRHNNVTIKEYYDKYLITAEDKKDNKEFISIKKGYETITKFIKCEMCGERSNSLKGLSTHLRKCKITTKEYYDKYLITIEEKSWEHKKFNGIGSGYKKIIKDFEVCELCGKKFYGKNGLSTHITQNHKISSKEYYNKYLKQNSEGICKNCGNKTKFKDFSRGYADFCSAKCSFSSEYTKEKSKITNLKKYKKEYYSQTKECKEKIKNNNLQKYGKEYYSQTKECKEKSKTTNLKKYKKEYYLQTKEFKEKSKITNLKKYKKEYYSQTKECKEIVIHKMVKTQKNNYWNKFNLLLNKKFIKPLFDKEYYCNPKYTTYKFRCLKCNKIFKSNRTNPQHFHCGCGGSSNIELQLFEWVKSLNKKVEGGKWFKYDKKRYELDIFLQDYNLGIELDGLYWHSTKMKKKDYHLDKTNWFKDNFNIDVIHIIDLEWLDNENRKEIENIIKYKLKMDILKENRYINYDIYDRRFFNEIKGKILKPKTLEFNKLKYQDCGYKYYKN